MAIDDMTTATHWARLWNAKSDWTWGAADGMQSRLGSNGYTYWCFGDTIQGLPNPADTSFDSQRIMVSNTIVMGKGAELGPATYSNGTPSVPDQTMNAILRRFWVTDIIFPSVYPNKAYALCQRIHDSGGWVVDGAMIAEFDIIHEGKLRYVQMHETPTTLTDTLDVLEIQWCQSWDELGGYIYIYGVNSPGIATGYVTPNRTYVARVTTPHLTNKNAWQIWTGSGWVGGRTDTALANAKRRAAPVVDGQVTSVRYDSANERWILAHKPFSAFGATVEMHAAPDPQGTWVLRSTFASPGGTSPGGNAYVTYNPTLHPKVELLSGQYLLSVSHNGDFGDIFDERNLYKPEWTEVAIPL